LANHSGGKFVPPRLAVETKSAAPFFFPFFSSPSYFAEQGVLMMMRIFLAGILGAIAMFAWNTVAHMMLPLGHMGISEIPNEAAVLSALQSNIGNQPGLYIFPGTGVGPDASKEEMKQGMERLASEYETKPTGVLSYRPPGRPMAFGKWLCREFALEFIESLLAAYLLAQAIVSSCLKRIIFVTIVGIVAAVTTNMSYWNWYGFPKLYTMGYMITQVIGFFCAGIVIALILKPRSA
jgi:hypothetical protein